MRGEWGGEVDRNKSKEEKKKEITKVMLAGEFMRNGSWNKMIIIIIVMRYENWFIYIYHKQKV